MVAHHDLVGVTVDPEEKPLGGEPRDLMILSNHGLSALSPTVLATFAALWTLQRPARSSWPPSRADSH
jgi:hypothetical protein